MIVQHDDAVFNAGNDGFQALLLGLRDLSLLLKRGGRLFYFTADPIAKFTGAIQAVCYGLDDIVGLEGGCNIRSSPPSKRILSCRSYLFRQTKDR